jgi:RND family efflux transporter MFP subunit
VHEVGPVRVHEPGAPIPQHEEEEGEATSFLKEQQWTLEFGTALVEERRLRSSITVPAVVQSRVGGDAVLSAPVPGRIDATTVSPVPGMRVRTGGVLARIVPSSDDLRDAAGLRADLVEAEQRHQLASQERDRVNRLVEARALPARRLLEAETTLTSAAARLEAARQRWGRYDSLSDPGRGSSADGAYTVRAPFDGVISEIRFSPGASVEQNQSLLRLVDPDHVQIVGAVPESRASDVTSLEEGELLRDGNPPVPLGKPLSIGATVDPSSRSMEVRFTLDNRNARLQVGRSVDLRLFLDEGESGPAIPESAVVDDGGRPVVFVQTGGESFDRRPVRLGSREQGFVHVLEGVEAGERVVHKGAYLIRLAAMSTKVPSHGHVH